MFKTSIVRVPCTFKRNVGFFRNQPEKFTFWKRKPFALPIVSAVTAMVAAPLILWGAGFTRGGITKGSLAAFLQSTGDDGISAKGFAVIGTAAAITTIVVQRGGVKKVAEMLRKNRKK